MLKQLYINGTGSSTFNMYINSDTYLNAPQIDYTSYDVPARNGSLLAYNRRLSNVIRKFDCFIKDDVNDSLDALKKLIYSNPGYLKISSDYDTDTYQEGYLAQDIQVEPFDENGAYCVQFSLYFSCKPEKRFTSGDVYTYDTLNSNVSQDIVSASERHVAYALNNSPIAMTDYGYGWVQTSQGSAFDETSTVSLSFSSDTQKEFMVIASTFGSPDGIPKFNPLAFIGATTNGKLEATVDLSSIATDSWITTIVAPFDIQPGRNTVTIVSSENGGASRTSTAVLFDFSNSKTFTKSDAVGCAPRYVFKFMANKSASEYIDIHYKFNDLRADFLLAKMVSELGREYVESNLFREESGYPGYYLCNIMVDTQTLDAYIVDANFTSNGKIIMNINQYFTLENGGSFGDTIEMYSYTDNDSVTNLSVHLLPRWWKL